MRKTESSNVEIFIDRLNFIVKTRAAGDSAYMDLMFQDGSKIAMRMRKDSFRKIQAIFESMSAALDLEDSKNFGGKE